MLLHLFNQLEDKMLSLSKRLQCNSPKQFCKKNVLDILDIF